MGKIMALLLISTFLLSLSTTDRGYAHKVVVKEKLSEYHFFTGDLAQQVPGVGVMPYEINTPLFSDYADKYRFLYLPEGTSLKYSGQEKLDFPTGAILIKTFFYPSELKQSRQLLETRLLIKKENSWKALVYVWNESQTDAMLELAGTTVPVKMIKEKFPTEWVVPNVNQCKGCHSWKGQLEPIGPKVSQLNRETVVEQGISKNQIQWWKETNKLSGVPEDLRTLPRMAVWNDALTGNVDQRARAWLDVNCAHCHRKEGPAASSGLFLNIEEMDKTALGIFKSPVAAGKGSGGMRFAIVPGRPKESFLLYRMKSTDPGVMMPELGRQVNHKEAIDLLKEWIQELK